MFAAIHKLKSIVQNALLPFTRDAFVFNQQCLFRQDLLVMSV
jgi:hypothetical protein